MKTNFKRSYGFLFCVGLFFWSVANASSMPENKVCFKYIPPAGFSSGKLTLKSFSKYTPKQDSQWYSILNEDDWGDVKIDSDDKNCLIVTANRKNSTIPVNFVKSAINWNIDNMVSATIRFAPPSELNFAFGLNLTFNIEGVDYTCSGFILGQGSDEAGINDWWIFSNNNHSDRSLSCVNNFGIKGEIYPGSHGTMPYDNHTFSLNF